MSFFCCIAVAAAAGDVRLSDEPPFDYEPASNVCSALPARFAGRQIGWNGHSGVTSVAFEFIPERWQLTVGAGIAPTPAPIFFDPCRTQPPPIR
jgi:hypothetical protein